MRPAPQVADYYFPPCFAGTWPARHSRRARTASFAPHLQLQAGSLSCCMRHLSMPQVSYPWHRRALLPALTPFECAVFESLTKVQFSLFPGHSAPRAPQAVIRLDTFILPTLAGTNISFELGRARVAPSPSHSHPLFPVLLLCPQVQPPTTPQVQVPSSASFFQPCTSQLLACLAWRSSAYLFLHRKLWPKIPWSHKGRQPLTSDKHAVANLIAVVSFKPFSAPAAHTLACIISLPAQHLQRTKTWQQTAGSHLTAQP